MVKQTLKIAKTGTKVVDTYKIAMQVGAEEMTKQFSLENRTINAVWPAEYSFMPHSIPDLNATIGAGPNIDIALFVLQGYASECERTFFTEEPTEEQQMHFTQMILQEISFSVILNREIKQVILKKPSMNISQNKD
ncbi:proline dipeptidase [Liquorilactobacillus hordei DSM 19519]|uniref:Proline dipeptidase n=1 Tax=Liquorilactobacillus hordei DSM 19519 TaxID=1423759 RepID=A0A0R1M5Z3_9LACO|nr:proline dipeptidase [Liquorilactobacillus hordei DSM 19519]